MLLVATTAAAGAGIAMALVTGQAAEPARPTARSAGVLTSGLSRLSLPDDWQPLRRPAIPGLEHAPGARGLYSDVAIDGRMPESPSLLPAPMLRALAGELPAPQLVESGGRTAWAYDLPAPGDEARITALTFPTTGGVVTVACLADASYASSLAAIDCDEALAALELVRVAPLPPAPETAARIVARPTIAALDDERTSARRALASTRSPRRRAAEGRRLAGAYAAAARRLEPLARGAARPLPRALEALARDYRSLAVASARRDARSGRRAGRAIDRRERRLASRLSAALHYAQ